MNPIQSFDSLVKEIKNNKYQHKYYSFDIPKPYKEEFINHYFAFAGGTDIVFQNNSVLPSGIDCVFNYCGLTFLVKFIE